jgi:hypothetical protein
MKNEIAHGGNIRPAALVKLQLRIIENPAADNPLSRWSRWSSGVLKN